MEGRDEADFRVADVEERVEGRLERGEGLEYDGALQSVKKLAPLRRPGSKKDVPGSGPTQRLRSTCHER